MMLAGFGFVAVAVLAWVIASQVTAAGGVKYQDHALAAFTPVEESTHNNNGDSVCVAGFQASQPPSENKGDLNAKKGSFLNPVQLAQGAKVKQLTLFVNDNDGDDGAHVFLIRKRIERGLSPQFKGYTVMAHAQSQGAVLNTMRKFTDATIKGATVDNSRYYYYLELVNCATVEPFAAQIGFVN